MMGIAVTRSLSDLTLIYCYIRPFGQFHSI